MADNSFLTWVMEQFFFTGGVVARPMFGGYGLYRNERFFGIVHDGRLYFKTSGQTRPAYEARNTEPFRPNPRQTLKNYYEVPVDVIEDSGKLKEWTEAAVDAGSVVRRFSSLKNKSRK